MANEPIALGDSEAEIDNIQYSAGDPRIVITREIFHRFPQYLQTAQPFPLCDGENFQFCVQGTAQGRETLTEGLT